MYEIEIHKLFSSSSNLSKKRKIKIGKSKWTWKNLTAKEKKIKFLVTQKEENCKWKWGLWDWKICDGCWWGLTCAEKEEGEGIKWVKMEA
jgi:hypothetical protein